MRKRAEKILWQIFKEEIPPGERWAVKGELDFIEAELTAAVKEEREKWEAAAIDIIQVTTRYMNADKKLEDARYRLSKIVTEVPE